MADGKKTKMAEFYRQCLKKGYTDMTDEKQSLKAKVIAVDLGLDYRDIASFYEKARGYYEEDETKRAAAAQIAKEERLKELRETARRAVDGELLLTIWQDFENSAKGPTIRVYLRPDGSVYSTANGGGKIEGAPTISVMKGGTLSYTYHPSKTFYTGATVGGISVGGVHTTQARYTEGVQGTGNGFINVSLGMTSFSVSRAEPSKLTKNRFRRSDAFRLMLDKDGSIHCVLGAVSANDPFVQAAMSDSTSYEAKMYALSLAADSQNLPYFVCVERANLLGQIINGEFPPTDEEYYEKACALAGSDKSDELKQARDIFHKIRDYSNAAQKEKETSQKYEEVLQSEKEQAVLAREREKKKRNKALAIGIPAAIVCIAAILFLTLVVIPARRYDEAIALMDKGAYQEAITTFERLGSYKDSAKLLASAQEAKAAAELEAANAAAYEKAEALLADGKYDAATEAFQKLGGYRDSEQRAVEAQETKYSLAYGAAEALAEDGRTYDAALAFYEIREYKNARERYTGLFLSLNPKMQISPLCEDACVLSDGTVAVITRKYKGSPVQGSPSEIRQWHDVVAISSGGTDYVALLSDGTVRSKRFDDVVSSWAGIVAVSQGEYHVVGLRYDGTVVAASLNSATDQGTQVSEWRDIIAISAGNEVTLGLRSDGTVVAAGHGNDGNNNVSDWTDIVAISAGFHHSVGLRADGTVVTTQYSGYNRGRDYFGWENVCAGRDIVAISAGDMHTLGLRSDGRVVSTKINSTAKYWNSTGQDNVSNWSDIVAIYGGQYYSLGLKADGTAVVTEYYFNSGYSVSRDTSYDVSAWTDVMLPVS